MIAEWKKVYGMLEDAVSRDIYLRRLNYLVSGDYKYIREILAAYLPDLPPLSGRTMKDFQASLPPDRKIVLYGAGAHGKEQLPYWEHDPRFIGFCCHTKQKQKAGYLGHPCMSPEELLRRKDLTVIVSVVEKKSYGEIMQLLRDGGYPESQIFQARGFFQEAVDSQYFEPEIITFGEDEVFLDVGCCDLNTALKFRELCGRVKKVYAFEPDPENYAVCLEKKERTGFQEVELLPFGTWSHQTTLHFNAIGTASSSVQESGETSIRAVPIDEVIDPADRVTMIKMDIEGAELESLRGARKIIQRDKPKLAICIYHKPEDMTEIPLYIKELVPEYRLYVRHYSNGNGETVLYAVMP